MNRKKTVSYTTERHDEIQRKLDNRCRELWDDYSDFYTMEELEVTAFIQILHELRREP